jgi:hypothetical protein
MKKEDELIGPVSTLELKCNFCSAQLQERVAPVTQINNYLKAPNLRQFRCPECPKLVTYFYDNELLVVKARTIWTQIKEKDIVVFKSYINNICYIEMYNQTNQVLNNVTNIPFEANITPANVDTKVPIYITFS